MSQEIINSLYRAAEKGNSDQVREIVLNKRNESILTKDVLGFALKSAATSGHEDVVSELLDCNADATAYGHLALCMATEYGYVGVVRRLLQAGADVHYGQGWPLETAINRVHLEVVFELVKAGAHTTGNGDQSMWKALKSQNRVDFLKVFIEAGIDRSHPTIQYARERYPDIQAFFENEKLLNECNVVAASAPGALIRRVRAL